MKVTFSVASSVMTVEAYKTLLTTQLAVLAVAKPEDQIELYIDIEEGS